MPKLIVEYYLTGSKTPTYILDGGAFPTASADYGEMFCGITTGSMSESELPTGVNVLTRDQLLSRSISLERSEILNDATNDNTDYTGAATDDEEGGPTMMTDSDKITEASTISASWAEL